jgi:hypothetical protein
MKRLTSKLKQCKQWILSVVIGRYYTEKEVKEILSKMQYEMAQQTIGNRQGEKRIVPMEFWMENEKYNKIIKTHNLNKKIKW